MAATTIKVSSELRDRLNEAAHGEGLTAGSFVERLLELYLREQRFMAMRAAMERTGAADRASYEDETARWDQTLGDGLERL